jgi:hypothetical protein
VEGQRLLHIPDNVLALYPDDEPGREAGAVSHLGVPLLNVDGTVLGHLAVLDRCPMPAEPRAEPLIRIFAARATAELQRLCAEAEVPEREAKLVRLVDSAMDAIVELARRRPSRRALEPRRARHPHGERPAGRPLVRVNCAAIPAALVESESFGHERGAFTGATQRREGRFAMAHGGTIFLDEVAELPADLQAELLRVLQEGEFEPVGSSQTRKFDVRVIAATNRDIGRAVREGGHGRVLCGPGAHGPGPGPAIS